MAGVQVCDVATPAGVLSYHRVGTASPVILGPAGAFFSAAALLSNPISSRFIKSGSTFATCVVIDRRGLGYSDPLPAGAPPTMERQIADLLAVMDHVGVERCFLSAAGFDAQATIAFAAEHPDRVAGVIAMATTPKLVRSDDHPSGVDPRLIEAWRASLDAPSTGNALDLFDVIAPSLRTDDRARAWFAQAGRHSASPSTAKAYLDVAVTMDVRPQLPQIAAPVLVLHNRDDGFIGVENARLLAELAPHGELAEFDGDDHSIFTGDYEAKVERVERFVTGTAGRTRRRRAALSWESMTPAERRVADLVAEGLTNPEIAARLSINRETVKTQVSAALRKTGARTRAELAAKLTAHLVDRPSVDHPDGG